MLPLRKLQESFSELMFDKTLARTALKDFIQEQGFSQDQRLQIYRNNIFITLTEALKQVYPQTLRLVGEDFFVAVAREYLCTHPSPSGSLDYFGEHYPGFLATFPAVAAIPYLTEMAEFEWAHHVSYHAEGVDSDVIHYSRLQEIPVEKYDDLQFRLHPSVQLCLFQYPIMSIWRYCQSEESEREEVLNLPSGNSSECILMLRQHYDVTISPLTQGEYALLSHLQNGQTFSKSCDLALAEEPELLIPSLIQQYCSSGVIVGLQFA